VTVVAHSMGGAVLTRAGQLAPELIAHAVYLAAFMPASGVPSIADADAAFPGNRTAVRELEASHSPFLSMPDQVAGIVLDVLS
jgi:pimeloyl-ACP methyl ester carboxylesterase